MVGHHAFVNCSQADRDWCTLKSEEGLLLPCKNCRRVYITVEEIEDDPAAEQAKGTRT